MATLIRDHGVAEANTSGTTITRPLAADVPAGRTLLAIAFAGSTSNAFSGVSKPVGESASWVAVGNVDWTTPDGTTRGQVKVWAIKTTIGWYATQDVTVTTVNPCEARTLQLSEWVGLSPARLGAAATASKNGNSGQSTLTVDLAPSVQAGDLVLALGSMNTGGNYQFSHYISESGTAGVAAPAIDLITRPGYRYWGIARARVVTGSGTRSAAFVTNLGAPISYQPSSALLLAMPADDYPPYQPPLTTNATGQTLDRAKVIRLGWGFSSPNAIDSQSQYDLRYREVGTTTWTTVTAQVGTLHHDLAAGTLAAGDYEWQVRAYGALGKVSPWSTSGFFTAATMPDGPSITAPIDGSTVDRDALVVWSTPTQDAYQFRRLGDDGGAPDPGVVYEDTGEVTSDTVRSVPVAFTVNGRAEHLQVRIKGGGLWSDWDSIAVSVSYTPPPTPTWTPYLDPSTGSLLIEITNPDPVGGGPAAVRNEVWIDDGPDVGSGSWERRADNVPTNGLWRYWTPVSGRSYATGLRVVAVAANGTTASSDDGGGS